jgi:predicted Zn-dependent peptidase
LKNKDPFDFEREILENGTEIFYQKGERDETEIRVLLKAGGARYDPIGKEGCAHMLEHLIAKKTHYFPDELAMSDFLLEHDLKWDAWTNRESIAIEGNSSSVETNSLFFLLEEFLKRSQLDEELLEKEKEIVISEMKPYQKIKNWVEVELETKRVLYGNHPFSRIVRPSGTLWTVNSLNVDDLVSHRKKFFVAPNLVILIISSLSLEKLKMEIQEHLTLPEGKVEYPKPPKDFPRPAKNLLSYSISEIMGTKEKHWEMGESVEFYTVLPTPEVSWKWEIVSLVLGEILRRKLRYCMSAIYSLSISATPGRDITELKIEIANISSNKTQNVIDTVKETILHFGEEKRFFEFLKRNKLRRLRNYQSLPWKIADEAIDDIILYDRPITVREEIEEIEKFDFEQAIDWVNRWLNEDRILIRIFTP